MTDKKLAASPDKGTFQLNNYLERCAKGDEELSQDYVDLITVYRDREADPEWQKNNMEYDMRSTPWFVEKVKNCDTYAQHLYAAMCNNDFQKLEVMPILKGETWSCSWRSAGGVVADLREEGDYIDWYCSGIGNGLGNDSNDVNNEYVGEGFVSEEIKEDLRKLGWIVVDTR